MTHFSITFYIRLPERWDSKEEFPMLSGSIFKKSQQNLADFDFN